MKSLRAIPLMSALGKTRRQHHADFSYEAGIGSSAVHMCRCCSSRGASTSIADPFTPQLQHKTEEELAKLGKARGVQEEGVVDEPRAEGEDDKQQRSKAREYGGPKGKEPTRFGDWEQGGRCTDF